MLCSAVRIRNRVFPTAICPLQVVIGRNPGCNMQLNDGEVSSRHLMIHWNTSDKCWQVCVCYARWGRGVRGWAAPLMTLPLLLMLGQLLGDVFGR
mgnify:CR=1 FL=1